MTDDDQGVRMAHASAYVGYALVDALLKELDKDQPGLRKRVWLRAQRMLDEYDLLDADMADWVSQKVADT